MTELSNTFVCIMGMGTVFTGLVLIVLICKLLSVVTSGFAKVGTQKNAAPTQTAAAPKSAVLPMPSAAEKAQILAGVCACIAEELGTAADNIKVTSFKRI